MDLLWTLAETLYLFAPLLVAAALSAVVHRRDMFPRLKRPIDGGATLGGRRVFGDSKTWRGVAIAVVGSIAAVLLQKYALSGVFASVELIDYERADPVALGAAFGVGATAGELPNSFVKRRLGIAPGATAAGRASKVVFWVWDQIDLVTVTWILLVPWIRPTFPRVGASVLIALVLHPLVALVGHRLHARRTAR